MRVIARLGFCRQVSEDGSALMGSREILLVVEACLTPALRRSICFGNKSTVTVHHTGCGPA
ncbi:hypothetical protein [Leisingera sp. NJS204]|uniref:hypothetical protein n=1 Tax=Leisingera sp. NJS204 TaxID=2508307 RepID=UPI001012D1B5|nr:hypothetical protein [Leisingera sp. NJS204]QAX30747.1 hypothetical protein ETW24_16005 [Leisingera sp. NJS204]